VTGTTQRKENRGKFIFWDGEETQDKGYCLFGCSVFGASPDSGWFLQKPFLRTREMLDLLLDISAEYPGSSHVAFSFDYDVNQILCDLPWTHLMTLRAKGKVEWRGYLIEHIPHKIFKVKNMDTGVRIRIDDIFSFFRCRYDKALRKHHIGDERVLNQIAEGKDKRAEFYYADIDYIRHYWGLEVSYGCQLMDRVRAMAWNAGFHVNNWHGPGALAAYSLKSHKVDRYMRQSPLEVHSAALSAYAGGWFERFKCGMSICDVWTADINSAYVYAMSLLPDLATGNWEHVTDRSVLKHLARTTRFGIFRYSWSAGFDGYMRACHGIPFPLFHREASGSIRRPVSSSGWVWNPEAAHLSTIPYAELEEAWIYHDDGSRPFEWVDTMFANRLAMQAEGDPSEKILKWALASYYGRVAQRTGWDEKRNLPPRFHQIEWAGWITSKCRAMVYRPALESGISGGLVSIDTDGVISTSPFGSMALETGEGNQLGRWKVEHYTGIIYLQNGVYWLRCDPAECSAEPKHSVPTWHDPKLRGIPRAKLDPAVAIDALSGDGILALSRRNFVGYGAALQGMRESWRTWVDSEIGIDVTNCGSRIHSERLCRQCKRGLSLTEGLHELTVMMNTPGASAPHRLPWLEDHSKDDSNLREKIRREHLLTEDVS
jgi:hypothetical protein